MKLFDERYNKKEGIRKMKKLVACLLVLMMAFAAAGCAKKAEAPAVVAPAVPAASSSATNAFAEASRDVAEARRCRTESPERALVLYENALALLSAEAGGDFNAKAAEKAAAAEAAK